MFGQKNLCFTTVLFLQLSFDMILVTLKAVNLYDT